MSRLQHYWNSWRTLSTTERRVRTGKVVERWLRRNPRIRGLGLATDPPTAARLRRVLRSPLPRLCESLRADDAARGPLFADLAPRAAGIARDHPDHVDRVLQQAEEIFAGRFDLLGSGGADLRLADGGIDWHRDWSTGTAWPAADYYVDQQVIRGDGSDVKRPWELSRLQHLLVLGQAYRLAGYRLDARSAESCRTRAAETARTHMDDWIARNPRGVGINWVSTMEVAIRAVNLIAAVGLLRTAPQFDDAFLGRVIAALWSHGRHIRSNLELTPATNHLVANLVGLHAIACALPELRDSAEWRTFAWRALNHELSTQVLPDGASFERSIPYHRLVTEMFLHAALTARAAGEMPGPAFIRRLESMLRFIVGYTRPDGTARQWGDNDDGRLLPLDGYATREPHDHRHLLSLGGAWLECADALACGGGHDVEARWLLGSAAAAPVESAPNATESRAFADVGYYVLRGGGLQVDVSCAPVGTRGLGNHSHNDVNAITVWGDGIEWITDPGSGSYSGDTALRNRLRSTAAHATLQLGTREQNPFGTGPHDLFRLDERARPEVRAWRADPAGAAWIGSHRGFRDTHHEWVHEREVSLDPRRRCVVVRDRLDASAGDTQPDEPVVVRYPIGAEIETRLDRSPHGWPRWLAALVETVDRGGSECHTVRLSRPPHSLWIVLLLPVGSRVELRNGVVSPRYGVCIPAPVVCARIASGVAARAVTIIAPGRD